MDTITRIADAVGRGLFAGAAGTAAMTVSSTLEAKLRGREPSSTPADAAAKVLGVEPTNPGRFSNVVHWSYGTSWGVARGLLAVAGLRGPGAAVAHFGAVWGSELAMLPALGVASPPWKWGAGALAIDAFHHAVYAGAANAAYAYVSP